MPMIVSFLQAFTSKLLQIQYLVSLLCTSLKPSGRFCACFCEKLRFSSFPFSTINCFSFYLNCPEIHLNKQAPPRTSAPSNKCPPLRLSNFISIWALNPSITVIVQAVEPPNNTPLSRAVQPGTGPRFGVTELLRCTQISMETYDSIMVFIVFLL